MKISRILQFLGMREWKKKYAKLGKGLVDNPGTLERNEDLIDQFGKKRLFSPTFFFHRFVYQSNFNKSIQFCIKIIIQEKLLIDSFDDEFNLNKCNFVFRIAATYRND